MCLNHSTASWELVRPPNTNAEINTDLLPEVNEVILKDSVIDCNDTRTLGCQTRSTTLILRRIARK